MSNKLGLERIIFFSDAVFAIAITLLALNIKLPQPDHYSASITLFHELLSLLPEYQSYAISFIVVGIYWMGHHHYFRYIKRYDYTFVALNIIFLMCVAFLPFPTAILDTYHANRIAVAFYAGSMAMTGFVKSLLWWYVSDRHRLVSRTLHPQRICLLMLYTLIPPVVFLGSIVVAYFNSIWAELSWGLIVVFFFLLSKTRNLNDWGKKRTLPKL